MSGHAEHTAKQAPAQQPAAKPMTGGGGSSFSDNRPEATRIHTVQRMMQSSPVAQRSTKGMVMPGLNNNNNISSSNSKKRGGDKDEKKEDNTPNKRTTRSGGRTVDVSDPTLSFTSVYNGVATQKLNQVQTISFDQQATLTRPPGVQSEAENIYDFRQKVTDSFQSSPVDTGHPMGGFVQDGPFRPDYEDGNIDLAPAYIRFNDHPGFNGATQIGAGDWLDWYEVRFKWVVKRRDGQGSAWTSPIVVNRVDSAYNGGNDVPVTRAPAPAAVWPVDLT